jgi:acyl dehydratase
MPGVEITRPPRLGTLYRRAVTGMLLPRRRAAGDSLPDTELVLRGVRADPVRLARYARVCGFPLTDTLPATYPHILAFPLALSLMTAPGFPFPAAGVVHLANRIEQHRPLGAGEALDLAVRAEHLRPHPRGRQVDVVAVATVDGTPVWRDVSTYLYRDRPRGGGARPPEAGPPVPVAVWRVGADVGRAYAAVSGDRNPIHTSTLVARMFGFRRKIAHGMWTKARCLAHLAPRLAGAYVVAVTFQAPVLLPSTVHFSALAEEAGWRFGLHDARSGLPHLSGTVTASGSVTASGTVTA